MSRTEAIPDDEHHACQSCGAALIIDADVRSITCPYCAAPSVVTRPEQADRPAPDLTVPFVIEEQTARDKVTRFLKSKAWAPGPLRSASPDNVRPVYLPSYLYSAVATSRYEAEIGERYMVTEKGPDGKKRTRVKTEWRSLTGHHKTYVKDIVITASRGLPNDELEAVEPFDLRVLRRFDRAFISGWPAEEPSLPVDTCKEQAHQEAKQSIGIALSRFMPGDEHRGLRFDSRLHNEAVTLSLLPLWIFAFKLHPKRPPVRVVVNGQTGKTAGRVPVSPWKVLLSVCCVMAVAAIMYGVYSAG